MPALVIGTIGDSGVGRARKLLWHGVDICRISGIHHVKCIIGEQWTLRSDRRILYSLYMLRFLFHMNWSEEFINNDVQVMESMIRKRSHQGIEKQHEKMGGSSEWKALAIKKRTPLNNRPP
ncbi:hypothetical protein Tco_0246353 [Tanacetum coccineum]